MKRIGVLLISFLFLFGCAGIQISQPMQDVVGKIAARHIGVELAKEYPVIANEVYVIAQTALEGEDQKAPMDTIKGILLTQIDDPLLEADIQDLLCLVDVNMELFEDGTLLIRIENILEGLVQGIELYKEGR